MTQLGRPIFHAVQELAVGAVGMFIESAVAITNLAQRTTKHATLAAIWYDEEEDAFVVQYEYLQLSFYKHEFNAFVDTLLEARENFLKGGRASCES